MEDSQDISRKLIEKYGWRQGLGLGKQNEGVSTYVRVSKKRDTSGIGIAKDPSTKLWNTAFWENMYNSAVSKCNDKDEESSSEEEDSKKKKEKKVVQASIMTTHRAGIAFQGMFVSSSRNLDEESSSDEDEKFATAKKVVQASIMTTHRAGIAFQGMFVSSSRNLDEESSSDEDEKFATAKKVSDWSSSKAKSLYHGRVSGKLERIRKQEEKWRNQEGPQTEVGQVCEGKQGNHSDDDETKKQGKKKRKKRTENKNSDDEITSFVKKKKSKSSTTKSKS
eukprot:TRINITY_DN3203_c1_g1_i1.p1 TRINITY_DN3203_c1_g1~~TRINITY_DN3203_c1_g1_i1.p1  ORF type:complete len:279 (-),score=115.04 TRINITY_DN3203_c1_g1_i1:108-944(-)